jgi:hypothetical protein
MIFKRKPPIQPNRRQRLTDELPKTKLSSFSYNSSSRTDQRAERQPNALVSKEKRAVLGRFWLQRFGLLILLAALAASLINILTLSTSAEIVPLTNSSDKTYLQPDYIYANAADKLLRSSVWNHSKVTVDVNGLTARLLQQFPELSNVSMTIPLLAHHPLIYIEPSKPALVLTAGNGSFVINTGGKAVGSLSHSGGLSAGLPTIMDESGIPAYIGQQALPQSDVSFTRIILEELAAKQYHASSLDLPAASGELDVHLTGEPYYIKFNLEDNDPAEQAGTFLAAMNSLKQQNITPSQYVDVRLNGRAYYQ